MKRYFPIVVAGVLTTAVFGQAFAQQEPWRLVQGGDGTLYVFRGDVRNKIVPAPMGDAYLVQEGEAWDDGFLRGTEQGAPQSNAGSGNMDVTAAAASGWTMISDVGGQQAVGTFSGQRVRATTIEMLSGRTLPASSLRGGSNYESRSAVGKFVVVLATVENVGSAAVCCLPEFRLRDGRGRLFTGDVDEADAKVTHAIQVFYKLPYQSDDYQPGLPIKRAFIYDVPTDAAGFSIAGDGR